jgi:hypothetical protein
MRDPSLPSKIDGMSASGTELTSWRRTLMSERTLARTGRLAAVGMLICAITAIGLILTGVVQVHEPRAPFALATK